MVQAYKRVLPSQRNLSNDNHLSFEETDEIISTPVKKRWEFPLYSHRIIESDRLQRISNYVYFPLRGCGDTLQVPASDLLFQTAVSSCHRLLKYDVTLVLNLWTECARSSNWSLQCVIVSCYPYERKESNVCRHKI